MIEEQAEKPCSDCGNMLPLANYSKGKYGQHIHVCKACMKERTTESNERRKREYAAWKLRRQQQEEEERQRRLAYEQRQKELEAEHIARRQEVLAWLEAQPERVCVACNRRKKAIEFSSYVSDQFVSTQMRTRCRPCHEEYRARLKEKRTPPCPVCHRPISSTYGHRVRKFPSCMQQDGIIIYICCDGCMEQFLASPESHQRAAIRTRCNVAIPAPQFIYAECEPGSTTPRYIGRTGNLRERHMQHLKNIKPDRPMFGDPPCPFYSRANWMYDLAQQGQQPHMRELSQVKIAPQVVEYERRYILHGIQQQWPLTNQELADDRLVERVRTAQIDFLQAPFEDLVKLRFFSSHSLPAFIREFYKP